MLKRAGILKEVLLNFEKKKIKLRVKVVVLCAYTQQTCIMKRKCLRSSLVLAIISICWKKKIEIEDRSKHLHLETHLSSEC